MLNSLVNSSLTGAFSPPAGWSQAQAFSQVSSPIQAALQEALIGPAPTARPMLSGALGGPLSSLTGIGGNNTISGDGGANGVGGGGGLFDTLANLVNTVNSGATNGVFSTAETDLLRTNSGLFSGMGATVGSPLLGGIGDAQSAATTKSQNKLAMMLGIPYNTLGSAPTTAFGSPYRDVLNLGLGANPYTTTPENAQWLANLSYTNPNFGALVNPQQVHNAYVSNNPAAYFSQFSAAPSGFDLGTGGGALPNLIRPINPFLNPNVQPAYPTAQEDLGSVLNTVFLNLVKDNPLYVRAGAGEAGQKLAATQYMLQNFGNDAPFTMLPAMNTPGALQPLDPSLSLALSQAMYVPQTTRDTITQNMSSSLPAYLNAQAAQAAIHGNRFNSMTGFSF
ncbi:hypothetical protein [Magnetofaba australis]|uniref:Uncharacterized protein n=1 Tax=Magnetofaba australis IT-1 TaxID=1434232 RepID=A0A1Y2K930_9PROT|nr:hypothetical protein [Magnetofaba australis]OSM07250.1 hypothetical protein MAIT1_03817 [Magnetofaba australis IT-1]